MKYVVAAVVANKSYELGTCCSTCPITAWPNLLRELINKLVQLRTVIQKRRLLINKLTGQRAHEFIQLLIQASFSYYAQALGYA
jgi:hypothetical protein